MINTETVQFIGILNELANKTNDGFHAFSKIKKNQPSGIIYDDRKINKYGYPVITDTCIDELHHDIISTYNDVYNYQGIYVEVRVEDNQYWIEITSDIDKNLDIVIENGVWYQTNL